METPKTDYPPVRTPDTVDVILFLIQEELKIRKIFNTLRDIGLDDCSYQPHLDELILAYMGLTAETNETLDFYYNLMETHSEKISPDKDMIAKEAVEVFDELMGELRKK